MFPIVASKYDYVNKFFNTLAPLVVNEYLRRKGQKRLYPSTVLAMAALESGYNLDAPTLFGIKGEGIVLDTTEYINGENVNIKDSFVCYKTLAESVQGLYELMQWSNYDRATSCTDYEEECRMVKECGYATDPNYADNLISIVNDFSLTMFNNVEAETEIETETETETVTKPYNYIVKSTDNLWNIVKEYYGLTNNTEIFNKVEEVTENNHITDADLIYTGQCILLY